MSLNMLSVGRWIERITIENLRREKFDEFISFKRRDSRVIFGAATTWRNEEKIKCLKIELELSAAGTK